MFDSAATLCGGSDRAGSDSGRLDPFVDIFSRPPPTPVAQPDVVRAGSLHSALALGCPVVQSGDRHTRNVVDFFGREHLTTVGHGGCHSGSLTLKDFVNL